MKNLTNLLILAITGVSLYIIVDSVNNLSNTIQDLTEEDDDPSTSNEDAEEDDPDNNSNVEA